MNKPSTISSTDLCVMCGMCIPHCPTYQLYQTETESPRGRIALIQAIENQRIEADDNALLHIDHCLGCLNCATICPSKVPYGDIIDDFRHQHFGSLPRPLASRQILKQAAIPGRLSKMSRVASAPLVKQLLKSTTSITRIPAHLLETDTLRLNTFYPSAKPSKGNVTLFSGCSARQNDSTTLYSASLLLNHLGFDVSIPEQQNCCGAIHQHNGQPEVAQQLLAENQASLQKDSEAILFFSPACGASLKKLHKLPVKDARSFIHEQLLVTPLSFAPCDDPVALHESCSHRNMLKSGDLNSTLLGHIPEINIMASSLPALCCGAGGLQGINYPEQAQAILKAKLESFELAQAKVLLSDNIGCSLHIKSSISAYNPDIEILHPVSLLARQLITADKKDSKPS